jgi:uncharacterized protein YbdZ (MbtH family)
MAMNKNNKPARPKGRYIVRTHGQDNHIILDRFRGVPVGWRSQLWPASQQAFNLNQAYARL